MYKIVHLITSLKTGGAETVMHDIVRNLDPDLFENHVIYFYDGPNVKRLEDAGIKLYKINGLFCKYDPIFILRLLFLIKKISPDCIHASLWSANVLGSLIAKLFKIPIACVLHLATNFESTGTNSKFRTTIDKTILPLSNKIIAVSDGMVEDLKNSSSWLPFNKLVVIRNGIDVFNIEQQSKKSNFKRSDFGIKDEAFVIGTVGRFIPRKNQKLLIEAFALFNFEHNNSQLVLVGYGPCEQELKNLVVKLGLENKVIFIKTENSYGIYPILNCFVLTSNNESFGLVTLEAMVFGLPIIVTHYEPKHEIVTNGVDGFVIPQSNCMQLYNKLKELYSNPNECLRLGQNARQTVLKTFDLSVTVKKYSKLFEQLIAK